MALTAHDIKAAYAQWEEWTTTEMGFLLRLDVCEGRPGIPDQICVMDKSGSVYARLTSDPYCRVRVFKHRPDRTWGDTVFDDQVPWDGDALKASVSVLAKTIAAKWVPPDDE